MSIFIDLTFPLPNREASSEQFSTVLPLQLQNDKWKKINNNSRKWVNVKTCEHLNTFTIMLKNIKMMKQ